MVEEQTARLGETDEAIRSKIDELLAGMTAAEKAGQLTQYFYFRLPGDVENPALGLDVDTQPLMVEAALGRGEAGSLLSLPTRRRSTACSGWQSKATGSDPVLFGFDRDPRAPNDLPVPIAMAASWDPETIERGQAVAAASRGPSASTGLSLRWWTLPAIRWGRIIEGQARTRSWALRWRFAQVRGFQGERIGAPDGSSPAEALRRVWRRPRGLMTTTRSTSPTMSSGTSTSRRSRLR